MKKAAALILSLVATSATVLQGTPALADDLGDMGALACKTNTVTTGYRAPGTVVNKFNGTCNDLNVTNTDDKTSIAWDEYAGMYRSGSTWITGTRGYIGMDDGAHNDVVLLSDVSDGTPMSVASWWEGGDTVKIKH
jgi:hypothetical protein